MTETELQLAAARAEREALRIQLDAEREAHKATKSQYGATDAEVRAFIAKCQAEQGRAFCAFCGEVTPREALNQHIGACAAHPMRAVEQERDSLKAQLAALASEYEAWARVAEEKIGRLVEPSGARRLAALLERFFAEHNTYPGDLPCSCDLCTATRAALAEVQR